MKTEKRIGMKRTLCMMILSVLMCMIPVSCGDTTRKDAESDSEKIKEDIVSEKEEETANSNMEDSGSEGSDTAARTEPDYQEDRESSGTESSEQAEDHEETSNPIEEEGHEEISNPTETEEPSLSIDGSDYFPLLP